MWILRLSLHRPYTYALCRPDTFVVLVITFIFGVYSCTEA